MIVVIGSAAYRPRGDGTPDGPEGRAPAIARAAVEAGRRVQIVARLGDDPAADALIVALARDGIGHAAVLRDAGERTRLVRERTAEADTDRELLDEEDGPDAFGSPGPPLRGPDIELALRYLADVTVVVAADPLDDEAFGAVSAAASFSGAHLVLISAKADITSPPDEDAGTTVLQPPEVDPEGAFARFVGRYAAALDAGDAPAEAFRRSTFEMGWEPVPAEGS